MLADIIPKIAGQWQGERGAYKPRPSGSGPERCIRQMVYHAMGVDPDPLSDRALLVFDDSSWHEELTADWIRQTAYQLHSEQMGVNIPATGLDLKKSVCVICNKAIPPDVLHGHIDGIITDALGFDRLWEHKAINHFAFQKYRQGTLPLDNLTQCCLYLHALQLIDKDIQECLLLMKNKNTAQYLEFLFEYDSKRDLCIMKDMTDSTGKSITITDEIPGIVGNAIEKFRTVKHHAEVGTLPDRQYDRSTWNCSYCSWGGKCWDSFDEQFKACKENTIELPDDLVQLAYRATVAGAEKKKHEKIYDESKKLILKRMMDLGASTGTGDGVNISLRQQQRKTVDTDATPESVLSQCTYKTSTSTIVTIRESKNNERN